MVSVNLVDWNLNLEVLTHQLSALLDCGTPMGASRTPMTRLHDPKIFLNIFQIVTYIH